MKRKFVEELLKGKVSDEELKDTVDSILDEHSSNVGTLKSELKTAQDDLAVANQTVENLTREVENRDSQLESLKNSDKTIEDLKTEITELQSENATIKENGVKEIAALKLEFAIDKELTNAKSKNNTAIKALLKLDDLEIQEDGTVKGLSEQIKTLVENEDTKFLFNNDSKQNFKGAVPGESGNEDLDDKVDLSSMTYDERAKYFEEHPEIEV